MKKWIAVIVLLAFLLSFVGCGQNERLPKMSAGEIVSIEIWSNDPFMKVMLDAEDIRTFVKLYNASEYQGEGTGVGGTPIYGAIISDKDGSEFYINEFNGNADLEVTFLGGPDQFVWCYADNQALLDYMADKLNGAGTLEP